MKKKIIMHGTQKIKFTRLFCYFGEDNRLLQISSQTNSVTIKAAIPFANQFKDIVRVELKDIETGELLDEYKK